MDLYNQIQGLPGTLTATNVKHQQSDYTNNKKDESTPNRNQIH